MILLTTAGATGLLVGGVQAANAATVTAKAGDTVSGLAKQYGSTVDAIEKANNINSYTHLIFAGQSYNVPDSASQQAATTQQNTTTQAASQQTQNQQVAQVQQQATQAQAQQAAPAQQTQTQQTTSSGSDASAKAWIANKESGGSYSAQNGQYVGKYQLSSSYLNGDYSAANQERVANNYVTSRYGSWTGAQSFWQANGWY
ncbi:aggregation-promoting factor [Loigolactobacillus iwatensis]|uniref:aggregation-promoting factor n=1 Tax=Loigolactobacillus iwatensis TaxID=1267156 RepID=UPI000F7DA518|nr:LysM domain-containing protein [Loigolactobacillus iwatensis]